MRRSAAWVELLGGCVGIAACGARTGLLLDSIGQKSPLTEVDAAVQTQSGPFVCPQAKLDVCGDTNYRAGAPWPTFQRCSSHLGRTSVVGPTNPVIKWQPSYKGDALLGPPSIDADGTIYVSGNGGLKAYNPDGTIKWLQQLSVLDTGSSTVAIGPDGTIYIGLDSVYALSPVDGSRVWTSMPFSDLPTPAAFGKLGSPGSSVTLGPCGTLFIGSPTGLHVTDVSGGFLWEQPGQGLTPAVDALGRAYYATSDGQMIAYNPDSSVRWTFALNKSDATAYSWIQPSPVFAPDGTVYCTSTFGLHALGADGSELWHVPWEVGVSPAPLGAIGLAADGTVYVAAPDLTLRAYTPGGQLKWSLKMNVYGTAPVIDDNGIIFELGEDGAYAITPDGQIEWILTMPGATTQDGTLALGGDGTLYVSTAAVYAIGNAP
jgi:hypothetical protein